MIVFRMRVPLVAGPCKAARQQQLRHTNNEIAESPRLPRADDAAHKEWPDRRTQPKRRMEPVHRTWTKVFGGIGVQPGVDGTRSQAGEQPQPDHHCPQWSTPVAEQTDRCRQATQGEQPAYAETRQ